MDEPGDRDVEDREGASGEEVVVERDHRTDAPTVTIKGLRKVFGCVEINQCVGCTR